jgi:magnesium chelatase subunit H
MGAKPRFDSYGRVCGAELIPLEELGRPRIDVVMTLSGHLPRPVAVADFKMLAEAPCWRAPPMSRSTRTSSASTRWPMRRAWLRPRARGLRVFSNADGAYGSNVNQLIDSGAWDDEDELAETYTERASASPMAARASRSAQQSSLLNVLADVDLAYQNLESVELGVTTIDHYFDTLGGISRAVSPRAERRATCRSTSATRPAAKARSGRSRAGRA